MTAIALVYTKSGFVVAADGLTWYWDDAAMARRIVGNQEQKIFKAAFGGLDIAWAITGSLFDRDGGFSLINETAKSMDVANAASPNEFGTWIAVLASRLRNSISGALKNGTLAPLREDKTLPEDAEERFTFARIFISGYFSNGGPAIASVRFVHDHGFLTDPQIITVAPPDDVFSGSREISNRYHGHHPDKRFEKYFRAPGRALSDGLAYAKGYIEACCDPLAAEVDPLCRGIGGHIHAAAVTPSGFKWLIEPRPKAL
jgi:hypothetical protein